GRAGADPTIGPRRPFRHAGHFPAPRRGRMRHLTLLALLFLGCPSPILYDYSKEPDPRTMEYMIGVPDSLKITVWKNPELSTEGRVRPDGTITMPLIGDLQAAGKTPSQLRQEISRRLSTYVRDESAVVSVAVTDVQSYHFTVAGNVEHPGLFSE